MKPCKPGLYRVKRFNYQFDAVEVIGHFAIADGEVVFLSSVDRRNCRFIKEGPLSGYTTSRIHLMLENAVGTAQLHLEFLPSLH